MTENYISLVIFVIVSLYSGNMLFIGIDNFLKNYFFSLSARLALNKIDFGRLSLVYLLVYEFWF